MGSEDRERHGEEGAAHLRRDYHLRLAVGLLVAIVLILTVVRPALDRERGSSGLRLELYPTSLGITLGERSLYPEHDPWREWLADESACPRGEDANAPASVQVQALLCLVNFARNEESLESVALSGLLSATAAAKARDIVLCHDFRHEACGKQPFQVADDLGYEGSLGENIYVGEGALGAPRLALHGWLNSQSHRENLFKPEWRTVGISLLGGAELDNIQDGVVWVNHFGP
jgi:uncharacterized protein YkwD